MPRQGRIDFPDAVHHIMCRGIERRAIFGDDEDRIQFLARLEKALLNSGTRCFAWALMLNHLHLLLQTGKIPLSRVLGSLLTSYAIYFNRRWKRAGHLFQNRYKSILCEKDSYLLTLVRYIHLNPLRAGIVNNLEELDRYPFSGHAALMGNIKARWQDVETVLNLFAGDAVPRQAYRQFIQDGLDQKEPEEQKPAVDERARSWDGRWNATKSSQLWSSRQSDERVQGSEPFVQKVLRAAAESEDRRLLLRRLGWTEEKVLEKVLDAAGIRQEELFGNSKKPQVCFARALACTWLIDDLGLTAIQVAKLLRVSPPTVSNNLTKGRQLQLPLL